jgi:hypothetical protein
MNFVTSNVSPHPDPLPEGEGIVFLGKSRMRKENPFSLWEKVRMRGVK